MHNVSKYGKLFSTARFASCIGRMVFQILSRCFVKLLSFLQILEFVENKFCFQMFSKFLRQVNVTFDVAFKYKSKKMHKEEIDL